MKSTSSKSIEQTLQPLGLSLTQIQNPSAVVEEVVVAVVAVVAVMEAVGVVAEIRNRRTDPLTRRLPMNRPVRRGNGLLNLMVIQTPE